MSLLNCFLTVAIANLVGLTHKLRNNEPPRHREASAPLRLRDLKQLARHGEIRV
ncbi:hypothetical protein [Nostoc sp.]|uniref:hypothetical protein n=1 Tax=Nostoc sp. TaxID=1180 RepID=UPI002FFB8654